MLLAASHATAQPLCDGAKTLLAQAARGFSGQSSLAHLPQAERCTTALAPSGAHSYHCVWSFPYRDAAAQSALGAFRRELETCLGAFEEVNSGQRVNHPDSYTQLEVMSGTVRVTLSLKDKAAHRRSYVFVGVEAAAPH